MWWAPFFTRPSVVNIYGHRGGLSYYVFEIPITSCSDFYLQKDSYSRPFSFPYYTILLLDQDVTVSTKYKSRVPTPRLREGEPFLLLLMYYS